MSTSENLGQLEMLLMSAVMLCGTDAYGMTIQEKSEELGRDVSLGNVYTVLDRLEKKGYLRSWFGDPTPVRGGKPKRYFEVTGAGEKVLKEATRVAENVVTGLREIWGAS